MPITQSEIDAAEAIQHSAAHDPAQHVRVVAGPGTGKSSAIEERIRWLLAQGVQPAAIQVVSFTRASSLDLGQRVHSYCAKAGLPAASEVRVRTLHSLALYTLRSAGLLAAYPADPLVLDEWELENVFDAEFGHATGIGKTRREKIRREHEAFWSTGQWGPANYVPADPPITETERAQFGAFHGPRTQSFSCVLPGEIVRKCVSYMAAGTLDAVALLKLEHLVVDEFQDLNPMDLEFLEAIVTQGATIFAAGDDDQSVYSFRFASPAGIQGFTAKYPSCGQHTLSACFRCTPNVLAAAQALIAANQGPNRIRKTHTSLYSTAVPPVGGTVHRWTLLSGVAEARAIAESCRDLVASGIAARDILVLLSNQRTLLPSLAQEFDTAGVPYEPPRTVGLADSAVGRLVLASVRIVCDENDYVAHRVLLGLPPGVGIKTCSSITDEVIANNLNYRSIFHEPLPAGVFKGRALAALNSCRSLCLSLGKWLPTDTVGQRVADITTMSTSMFSPAATLAWQAYASTLPAGMTLAELRDFLWADTDEQQSALMEQTLERLSLPIPTEGLLAPRVRVMTMHGAKGLSAKIVFVPGLEEETLPGHWRQPYPGLVLEAARLLYVSVTRARAACVLSYSRTRVSNGKFGKVTPSRFTATLGGQFSPRSGGLTALEVQQLANEAINL